MRNKDIKNLIKNNITCNKCIGCGKKFVTFEDYMDHMERFKQRVKLIIVLKKIILKAIDSNDDN